MQTPPIRIRPIRPDDLPALLDLYLHMHVQDDPLPPEPRLRAAWDAMLSRPGLTVFVAESDGRLVSSCVLAIIPNLTRGCRPYGLIENVVTHADYRRRGLATAVIQHALDAAWQAGCYKVMLLTGRRDPATLRFYEKCGFRRDVKTGFLAKPE